MTNISFANPYLLILLLPMLALVLVPYFIAIRKQNKSAASTVALALHIAIVLLVILAVSGTSAVTVITETELYVVADVSYSTHDRLDLIDDYIARIKSELPANSEMGVITFGKNYRLHTPLGEQITSVKNNKVNGSATDIASALGYAESLFSDAAIKRIVLITDGMSTDPDEAKQLIRAVEELKSRDVYVDAVYVDTALTDSDREVQLSSVDFLPSVYNGRSSEVSVLVESSYEADVILTLQRDGEPYLEKAARLTPGFSIISFELYTDEAGSYDYTVSVHTNTDSSSYNNSISFTQTVSDSLNILLVTSSSSDTQYVEKMYANNAVIDTFVKPKDPTPSISDPNPKPVVFNVPCTVEDLCKYDEIIISDVDVRSINNCDNFIKSLDTVVSLYGKSLITAGNTHIQNKDDQILDTLGDMLPVKFNDSGSDSKLYMLLIDSSRSMEFRNMDYFVMAKRSAEYILGLLDENDYFAIYNFAGEVYPLVAPQTASEKNIESALKKVNALEVSQSTMIGSALKAARELMTPLNFTEKQIMLISDGMTYAGAESSVVDPVQEAELLLANNITVSTLNTGNEEKLGVDTLRSIAGAGGGGYYFCPNSSKLEDIVLGEVADDVNQSEILAKTRVNILNPLDKTVQGITSVPDVYGYIFAGAKASAQTVLGVDCVKPGGRTVSAPLYAYWSYGEGRVATLTTKLGGEWVKDWGDNGGGAFLSNIASTNLPEVKIDYPYTVSIDYDGTNSHVEIIPASPNPDAVAKVTVILPDGSEINEKLSFNSYRYLYKFETNLPGKYTVKVSYNLNTKSYDSETVYTVPYSPEYDSFASSSPAPLYAFIRNNGNVFEDGNITLEVDESKIATYILRFEVPFLAAAAALYIVDTVIRKLKWADIRSLFAKKRKENER